MIIALQTLVFFRESLLTAIERLLSPYYRRLSLVFNGREDEEVEDEEDEVFADFDDERGVVFFPPMYAQRYAAVSDCLMDERWAGKLEKVVDLGYHDMSFIKYLKDMPGVRCIYGVDIDSIPLRCSSDLFGCQDYVPTREIPLHVTLFQGNAADPDYRLIGTDAVIAIEMIEHMLPHDLERLVHNVFGFIQPWIAIFTTPNGDFNTLFKNLEQNGLRRLDHLFEWTREQFHDWCSNIVSRYPTYTVHCKGIGPGPPDTEHLGCCSQMALFINDDYHKQPNLDLNSLALVAKAPSACDVQDIIGWETPQLKSDSDSGPIENVESLNEFLDPERSCITVFVTQSESIEELEYRDRTSQCNMDCEYGRNYLMFDDDQSSHVVVPRRTRNERVYFMEDVYSRLNCSTFQVKKFSKTTQDVMAKNKVDSLVHTRAVVNEIRHLTKVLNFKKVTNTETENGHIWCNINWGDNAPYWNQYYQVVREYNYPFEAKSDDCRILDLISEELNRLIDIQYDEEFAANVNKLEIPIAHLMGVVRHITTDIRKVKDLLEWNGYEVVNETVVHSRLLIDTPSIGSREDEWIEHDASSDWDTDVHSTSDGSNAVPDYHGRFLRRALDRKVRKVRSMLSVEKDMTNELDRVVCRLMKLALWTSTEKQQPPPSRWMQCKLLDLLTLTEKAITRRKKYFMEECIPLKAIDFVPGSKFMTMIEHVKDIKSPSSIESRYKELCYTPEISNVIMESEFPDDVFEVSSHDDLLTGYDFNFDHKSIVDTECNEMSRPHDCFEDEKNVILTDLVRVTSPKRTPYKNPEINDDFNAYLNKRKNNKKSDGKPKHDKNDGDNDAKSSKTVSKVIEEQTNTKFREDQKAMDKIHKYTIENKMVLKKTSSRSTKIRNKNKDFDERPKKKRKKKLHSSASKPIPGSIIELCHPDLSSIKTVKQDKYIDKTITQLTNVQESNVSATKESLLIGIISGDREETIALRRTIGTDVDEEQSVLEQETLLSSVVNTDYNDYPIDTDNIESQSIFLYDINEPSTSKGVRHTSLDVQCGPDDSTPAYVMLSPASSVTKIPATLQTGIKLGHSTSNVCAVRKSFGTSTYIENFGPVCPRNQSISLFQKGIKIGDSETDITINAEHNDSDYNSAAIEEYEHGTVFIVPKFRKTGILIKDTSSNESPNNDIEEKDNNIHSAHNEVEHEYTEESAPSKKFSENKESSPKNSIIFVDTDQNSNGIKSSDGPNSQLTENEGSEDGSSCKRFRRLQAIKDSNNDLDPREAPGSPTLIANEVARRSQSPCLNTLNSIVETELIKPISCDLETQDSNSDFCASIGTPKSPVLVLHTRNTSDRFSVGSQGNQQLKKYERPKLNCGGIHTHSYRDNQIIEDVMYQGKWQKNNDYKSHKRTISPPVRKINNVSIRKLLEKPKEKVHLKNDVRVEPRQKPLIKYTRLQKSKQNLIQSQTGSTKNATMVPKQTSKPKTPSTEVSKTAISLVTKIRKVTPDPKNMNSKLPTWIPAGKNLAKVNVVAKKSTEKIKIKQTRKSYIPLYLKRQKMINKKMNLDNSFNSTATTIIKRSKCSLIEEQISDTIHQTTIDTNHDNENTVCEDVNSTAADVSVKNEEVTLEKENVKNIFEIPDEVDDKKLNFNVKFSTPTIIRKNKYYVKHALKNIQKDAINVLAAKAVEKDLFRFNEARNISYCVFRNELENNPKGSTNCNSENSRENTRRKANGRKSSSPISQTSSCSSPDSVATVKMVHPRTTKRYSTSSNKSSLVNSESEPTTPARTRRYTKRIKSKKADDKDKENVPETSSTCADKEADKSDKGAFSVQKKKVYLVATETPTLTSLSKHQSQATPKSSVKIPMIQSSHDKKRTKPVPSTVTKKKSLKSNDSSYNDQLQNQDSTSSEISNMVMLIDSRHQEYLCDETVFQSTERMNVKSSASIKEIVVDESFVSNKSGSTVSSSIRHMIEEKLEFINTSSCEIKPTGEAEALTPTVVSEPPHDSSVCHESENWSYTTEMAQESFWKWHSNNVGSDPEALSFKSVTSASKYSDYFLADNEFEITVLPERADTISAEPDAQRSNSVRDIFERKEPLMAPTPASGLAVQAFSGFSMNAEPVSGDQPDYCNLVDSETGSLSADYHTRQAASEELFVSGRSSESYESCLIDEDAVVPNWLFEIIQQQQQQQMAAADAPPEFIGPLPVAEPNLDVNNNMSMEPGMGVGAGAGDGRGIHSDHSQDSSGRGTSLSSSDTSSGQTSEVLPMDPSAFVQYELLHDAVGSSNGVSTIMVTGELPVVSFRNPDGLNESEVLSTSRTESRRNRHNLLQSSDADADVSSIDTDVPDSS